MWNLESNLSQKYTNRIQPESILSKFFECQPWAYYRDGSSLFFLDRVEPEPIFFGSGQAWATDFVSQAYASQKKPLTILYTQKAVWWPLKQLKMAY